MSNQDQPIPIKDQSAQKRLEKGTVPETTALEGKPEDEVDEASEESFPASDSPAWTGAVAH